MTSAETQAQIAEWFGEAPANEKACDLTSDEDHCDTFHAGDTAYWEDVYYWQTPDRGLRRRTHRRHLHDLPGLESGVGRGSRFLTASR